MIGWVRAGLAVTALLVAPIHAARPVPASAAASAPVEPSALAQAPDKSLMVETQGRQATSASYPFVVGEGATISGKLRFLSYEYPEYFGTEYNDLFSVTLATPQGAVVLATGNLNNSTWGPGSLGYTGTSATLEFNEDLSRFVGQTVELQIHVANVADTFYDSAVAVSDLRVDDKPPCSDDQLRQQHGVPDKPRRESLDGFDSAFSGRDGARFRSLVETIAAEAGISPGLLAVNALTERDARRDWLTPDPVATWQAGVDDWVSLDKAIRSRVPGAPRITATATGEVFENELGREIPVFTFGDGRDALRAIAWTLRYAEVRMTDDGWSGYGSLSAGQRFALDRFAFNRGVPAAVNLVRQVGASGNSVLIDSGDASPSHPQRAATIRAAQAVHLANTVFGEGTSCP
jgi:hypothetical protein